MQRPKTPPASTRRVLGDLAAFVLHRPEIPTQIDLDAEGAREEYHQRMLQRLGIDVSKYSVLNLHQIGIEAPCGEVFEEFMQWDGTASCWPNHIATVERVEGSLEKIRIRPLGQSRVPLLGRWARSLPPLFDLSAIHIQSLPDVSTPDNARYFLYACGGGYPIGIFALYMRSAIAELGETESTQLFLGVGFDFYGNESWRLFRPVNRIWRAIHNRVTANMLNRLKQLSEWRFERKQQGR